MLCGGAVFSPRHTRFCAGRWPSGKTVDIPSFTVFWSRNFSGEQIVSRHVMFSCTHRLTTRVTLIRDVAHHRTTDWSSSCVSTNLYCQEYVGHLPLAFLLRIPRFSELSCGIRGPDELNRTGSRISVARCIATVFQTAQDECGVRTVSTLWLFWLIMENDGLII